MMTTGEIRLRVNIHRNSTTHIPTTHGEPSTSEETEDEPETPGQDDDPEPGTYKCSIGGKCAASAVSWETAVAMFSHVSLDQSLVSRLSQSPISNLT